MEFDYSTEVSEESENEEQPKELSIEEDDYSADPDYTISTITSSRLSNQSNEFAITSNANHTLIYLNLREPIAKITMEPFMDPLKDENEELITKLKKFLGLLSPRRNLYYPSDDYGGDKEEILKQLVSPSTVNHVHLTGGNCSTSNLSNTNAISWVDMKRKIFHDYLEPFDLTELPPQTQRDQLCRQHYNCIACLEEHPLCYSFIESLNPEISLNMCHPMAVTYRMKDFQQSKQQLAKKLFNMFNHRVFYCGLDQKLYWKRLKLSTSCLILSGKDANRSATIILSDKIQKQDVLVKTLLHEMCHAAAFVFNSEIGHGDNCRKWTYLSKFLMPELPLIENCDATYKYSCYLCGASSFGRHVELIDGIEHLHCSYCQFEVIAEPWEKDNPHFCSPKDSVMTPYKKFIKNNYLKFQSEIDINHHNEKMRQLNLQYIQQISNN